MATDSLVNEQIDFGRRLISDLRSVGFDVTAAFWVKTSYDGTWSLYIASTLVDTIGRDRAYEKLYAELTKSLAVWLSRPDIKLIGVNHPIAADVVAIQGTAGAPLDTRFGGDQLGDLFIEDAYFYHVN
jgi:hypothetical protein